MAIVRRLERYLATAPADVVVLSEFGPDKRPLLRNLEAAYPFQVDCAELGVLAGAARRVFPSKRPGSGASPPISRPSSGPGSAAR